MTAVVLGAPEAPATPIERWYVRCLDCLQVGVIPEPLPAGALCQVCRGTIESMGRVEKVADAEVLVQEEERAPCDGRCTHARGPICTCRCQGCNHGTGRVVTVIRVVGQVPEITMPAFGALDAMAYRQATREVSRAMEALATEHSWAHSRTWVQAKKALMRAARLRVHKLRMNVLVTAKAEIDAILQKGESA